MYMKNILKTNDYKITDSAPPFNCSNHHHTQTPYNYNFHAITIKILEDNLNYGEIIKYESNATYYNELIDLLIKDKQPINYIIKPNGYNGKSNMHNGIITKRINSSIILNDYKLELDRFYILEIHETITQQIQSVAYNMKNYINEIKKIGNYDRHDYTQYEINDYLTKAQLQKQKDKLKNNNFDFID